MKLYVAGPMRGYQDFNFPAFDHAAKMLRAQGHTIVSPAERDRAEGFDETRNSLEGFDVKAALADDFRFILESDGIVLLDGWEQSTGARAERFVAEMTGRHVFVHFDGDLFDAPEWDGNPLVPESKGDAMREEDVELVVKRGEEWLRDHPRQFEDADIRVLIDTPEPEPPETILQEAQRLVHGDRGEDYGHPIHDFTRTGRMWGAILGIPDVAPELIGLCMVALKMSREVNKAKRDNRTDMAGYAETVDMIRQYQAADGIILTPDTK